MSRNREYEAKIEQIRSILVSSLPSENLPCDHDENSDECVKNDGMSDQPKQSLSGKSSNSGGGVAAAVGGGGGAPAASNNGADNRPGSARSNRERHERVILLKERQNSERIRKLEELKEQALAAARLREEQDSKRRRHFEELGRKDEERRRQAEERRRMLDEERRMTLQTKWETKRQQLTANSKGSKPTYAFGSCTPRLLDNHVDGFLWKSQYNLNVAREPGMRASSAHDLHLQQNEGMDSPSTRVFCGRRKTDLTPTIPIKRDDYSVMSRSTSRGSGRVYSSMTRLDRSRSPGGSLTQYQHHPNNNNNQSPQRPSRSKSTTHLHSAGLKMTRTEILRQALAKKEAAGGIRSVDASRPPSSMSSSLMTSSTHSQVQMRPRTSYVRKTRPASVHVTGVSSELNNEVVVGGATPTKDTPSRRSETPLSAKSNVSRKASNETTSRRSAASQAASGKSSGKTSPSPMMMMSQSMHETNTIKRPIKKKVNPAAAATTAVVNKAKTPEPAGPKVKSPEPAKVIKSPEPKKEEQVADLISVADEPVVVVNKSADETAQLIETTTPVNNKTSDSNKNEMYEIMENESNKVEASVKNNVENFESIESAFASGSEDFTYSSKTPEPFAPSPSNTLSELNESAGRDSASSNATLEEGSAQQWSNPFITNTTPEPTNEALLLSPDNMMTDNNAEPDKGLLSPAAAPDSQKGGTSPLPGDGKEEVDGAETLKPKIMTEEEAKAALAEKRRLAREAVEREAARIAELELQELERQRLEEEEAERLAVEARQLEEERLRKAIEEEQKRQEEERKRKEEDEKARQEKEKQERAAAKEAERIRLEMEERLRREEAERLERKRRVEAIMSRTRKKEAEQQQAKSNNTNSNSSETLQNDVNGHKESIINQENIIQSSVNSLNNNFNNNNTFSGRSDEDELIDNNSSSSAASTLISFEGTSSSPTSSNTTTTPQNNVADLLFSQQDNISPDHLLGSSNNGTTTTMPLVPTNNAGANNSIINNPLQDLLS